MQFKDELVRKRERSVDKDKMKQLLRATLKHNLPKAGADLDIDTCNLIVHVYVPFDILSLSNMHQTAQFVDDFLNDDPHWSVIIAPTVNTAQPANLVPSATAPLSDIATQNQICSKSKTTFSIVHTHVI